MRELFIAPCDFLPTFVVGADLDAQRERALRAAILPVIDLHDGHRVSVAQIGFARLGTRFDRGNPD